MKIYFTILFLVISYFGHSQSPLNLDTFYLFDLTVISDMKKYYKGTTTVYFSEKDSLVLKADRKKRLFDNLIPYFDGVEVIVPFNQSPKTVRVRVREKDRRKEIYCDTLLTLTKTKKTPYFYFFFIYNRGLLSSKNENPCRRLEVVNTDQTRRYAYNELTYEFDRFYSWRYDYRDNNFMRLY